MFLLHCSFLEAPCSLGDRVKKSIIGSMTTLEAMPASASKGERSERIPKKPYTFDELREVITEQDIKLAEKTMLITLKKRSALRVVSSQAT